MPVVRYTNTIKSIWEKYLRVIFASDTTPAEYRYTPNERTSKLRIYKEFPRRDYNLPLIVIAASNGNASLRYLGDEAVKDVYHMYNECVQNNTLRYTPIKDSVVGTFSLDPITGAKTVYVANKDFSVDCLKRKIVWDKGVEQPELYYTTYATFTSTNYNNTIFNEYHVKNNITNIVGIYDSNPTGEFNDNDKYYNTKTATLFIYESGNWIKGEYAVLGDLYLDTTNNHLYEYTTSGMVRVYAYDGFPRLYLDYYTPEYDQFLVEDYAAEGYINPNPDIEEGYVTGSKDLNWKQSTYLEYQPASIIEVYSYNEEGQRLYYNSDEVYVEANSRKLVWTINEPDRYFVTYISAKNLLSHSGKFVQSPLSVDIRFDVYGRSSQDRERLTDLLVLYIRHLIKPSVAQYFVYSGEQVSGESQENLDNQTIYKNSITVPCVSHYSHYIDNSVYALIKSIVIDVEADDTIIEGE